ncbi:hypothetical protein GOP47_0018383 [Adiantum capillus-veneris]|uniref:Uncharacterized protein n=1 Tax=Adiantum capillus-veneris TaxID=13818 RepID=A0A9D4UEC6_ADICA|nr:hypothetical protein GOP47_0018383 [Adiantum capillus-veneris]
MDEKDDLLQFHLEQQLCVAKQRDKELVDRILSERKLSILPSSLLAATIAKQYSAAGAGADVAAPSKMKRAARPRSGAARQRTAGAGPSSTCAGVAGRKAGCMSTGLELAMRQFLDNPCTTAVYVLKPSPSK